MTQRGVADRMFKGIDVQMRGALVGRRSFPLMKWGQNMTTDVVGCLIYRSRIARKARRNVVLEEWSLSVSHEQEPEDKVVVTLYLGWSGKGNREKSQRILQLSNHEIASRKFKLLPTVPAFVGYHQGCFGRDCSSNHVLGMRAGVISIACSGSVVQCMSGLACVSTARCR